MKYNQLLNYNLMELSILKMVLYLQKVYILQKTRIFRLINQKEVKENEW